MRAAGVDIATDYSEVSVVGITEISAPPSLIRAMRHLVSEAERANQPSPSHDFPGFHLRLARKLKSREPKHLLHLPAILGLATLARPHSPPPFRASLCIFPFEEKFFGDAGVRVKFIGAPTSARVHASLDRETFLPETRPRPTKKLGDRPARQRSVRIRQHLYIRRHHAYTETQANSLSLAAGSESLLCGRLASDVL